MPLFMSLICCHLFRSEREDPDTVVLEYHPIVPVDLRKYDPLPNDLTEARAIKERYNLYSQREVHYWKVSSTWEGISLPLNCWKVLAYL